MPSECAAVIKADGYGCGIEKVAGALAKAGCKTFFVADLAEARKARAAASEPAIYVLNGLMSGTAPAYADIRARPVIGSMVELAEWDAFCTANQWHGGAALHVDTGMNRLGVSVNDAAALAPRIRAENHGITLLMSHLACAETPDIRSTPRSASSAKCAFSIAASLLASPTHPEFPGVRPLRHGAAGRCALRRQSDPRAEQSDAP